MRLIDHNPILIIVVTVSGLLAAVVVVLAIGQLFYP
jgi:hypothetical protein